MFIDIADRHLPDEVGEVKEVARLVVGCRSLVFHGPFAVLVADEVVAKYLCCFGAASLSNGIFVRLDTRHRIHERVLAKNAHLD